jgi:8-oxo-dGTP pyrophosphatase MutT (NUDIX family)
LETLPLIERDVVRLVVLDDRGRILLLQVRDASNPAFGTAWELPGGGIEPGETHVDAAVRELREETGIGIDRDSVSAPTWRRDVGYTYRGARRLAHECVVAVRLHDVTAALVSSYAATGTDFENDDLLARQWWSAAEIAASAERFYPRSLPVLLPQFLAGETLIEPFESWP